MITRPEEHSILLSTGVRAARICTRMVQVAAHASQRCACAGLVCAKRVCGTYLIREGMPSAGLADKCGEPDTSEAVREPIMARRANGSALQIGVTTKIELIGR